jgi:hypothetical protein
MHPVHIDQALPLEHVLPASRFLCILGPMHLAETVEATRAGKS